MDEDKEIKVDDTAITTSNNGTEKHNGIQHTNAAYQLNYMSEAEIAGLELFIKRVMRSDKCGIKSIEDGLAIAMRAKDLRLPFSTCIEHIHAIQGKTGVDVHIIKALLVKGSVSWEKIDDYRALYEYTDGFNAYDEDKLPSDCIKCLTPKEAQTKNAEDKDHEHIYVYPVKYYKDYNGNVYKEYQLNGKFEIATNTNEAKQIASTGKVPVYRIPAIPIDYITRYRFYRKIGGRDIIAEGEFTYKDAIVAGCFEKDTYKKYPKIMISHRAFVYGAREIANDLIMGCLSTEELKTMQGIDLSNEDIIDITEIQ